MEHLKIFNLSDSSDSKFMTRTSNIVNDQSNGNYVVGNKIIYNIEVLKCDISDYSDAYTLVRGEKTNSGRNPGNEKAFKNFAPFIKCIRKIDGATIDDD